MTYTNFGYQKVPEQDKAKHVREVFDSVASKYDLMNDLMSFGMHRIWKAYAVLVAQVKAGQYVLDIAGGTGDLAHAFARKVSTTGCVVHTDINYDMLRLGRDKLLDKGIILPTLACDAENLPFPNEQFDLVSVGFGLRNMTNKEKALEEMQRVLKPRGKLLILEFSQIAAPLQKAYDWYSFNVLPHLGQIVAGDADSYRYLAESIRVHPNQEILSNMLHTAGFGHVDCHNMAAGAVALHIGIKC